MKNEFGYAGGSSIDAKYDYRKLGETWSTPRIIRIKISGKDKWVAVFGGGYNGAVNPNVGSAVFVLDLEDEGRLLKVIHIDFNREENIVRSNELGFQDIVNSDSIIMIEWACLLYTSPSPRD